MTPRTGDRVLVSAGPTNEASLNSLPVVSATGTLRDLSVEGLRHVILDLGGLSVYVSPDRLTVLDREPVEWPEGWTSSFHTPKSVFVPGSDLPYGSYVSRTAFDRIRGPEGDYVAEHWDDLMGEA